MRLNTRLFSHVSAKSFLVGAVILIATAAFIFTGFGTINLTNILGLDPGTAAKIGSVRISMQEFANAMRKQKDTEVESDAQQKERMRSTLQSVLEQKSLIYEAYEIGWKTFDAEIAAWVKEIPQFQDPATKKFSVEIYKKFLKSGNLSELEFYNLGREAVAQNKMVTLLSFPTYTPKQIVDEQTRMNNTKFNLEYALIAPSQETLQAEIEKQAKVYLADPNNETMLKDLYEQSQNDRPAAKMLQTFEDAKPELAKKLIEPQVKLTLNEQFEHQIAEVLAQHNSEELAKVLQQNKIAWTKMDKPFGVKDYFITSLGTASELKDTVFSLKAPGDTTGVLNFSSKKAIVRLISFATPDKKDGNEKQNDFLERMLKYQESHAFFSKVEKKLYDELMKSGRIKINSTLNP